MTAIRVTEDYFTITDGGQHVMHNEFDLLVYTIFEFAMPELAPGEKILSATLKDTNFTVPVVGNKFTIMPELPEPTITTGEETVWNGIRCHFVESSAYFPYAYQGWNPTVVLTIGTVPEEDTIPPVTQATINPPPNAAGWNNSDVTITLSATDNSSPTPSGVKEIHYSVNGQAEVVVPGNSATIPISDEGEHTVQFYAMDNAGNTEATKSITVRIDKTPPTEPKQVKPPDKAEVVTIAPTFAWDISVDTNPVKYTLCISISWWGWWERSFIIEVPGIMDTSYTLPQAQALAECQFYYWGIKAEDIAGNITWSSNPLSFHIKPEILGREEKSPEVDVGDAINVTNGNMYISVADLFIPGRGMPLSFGRTYNSRDTYSGPLGYGWTHSYNIRLTERPDGSVALIDEDSTRIIYSRNQMALINPRKANTLN